MALTFEEYYGEGLLRLKQVEVFLLHLVLRFHTGLQAEIQLRTIALDFWAALEHQMKYKKNIAHEKTICDELKRCADEIASVDMSMQTLRELIRHEGWED